MTKIKTWLDSGANINSCNRRELDLEEDLGLDLEEWNAMTDNEREELMRELVWEDLDWGFHLEETE